MKIPARRAEYSLTENVASPFQAEPRHTAGLFITGTGGHVISGMNGTTSTSVFNVDASGNGFYAGNLNVTGNLTKRSGSFKIDHPLDPANKYLSHSFVESPDMMNIYNGVVVLDSKGEASVILPEYFQALNSDFRYQLTAIGAPGPNLGTGSVRFPLASTSTPNQACGLYVGTIPGSVNVHPAAWKRCCSFLANCCGSEFGSVPNAPKVTFPGC